MAQVLKIVSVSSTTSSVNVAYQPSSGAQGLITDILISNVGTATATTVSVCVTSNGSGYASANAIIWNKTLDTANQGIKEIHYYKGHGLNLTNAGSIGVGGTANFNITILENII